MSKPFTDFETEWNDVTNEFVAFKACVAKLLKKIEFCRAFDDRGVERGDRYCPFCEEPHTRDKSRGVDGHDDDCELAALLKECEIPSQPVRKCLRCGETAEVYAVELPHDPRDVTRRYEEWCRKCIGYY